MFRLFLVIDPVTAHAISSSKNRMYPKKPQKIVALPPSRPFPLKKVFEPKKAVGHKAYSEKGIKECQTQKGRLSSTRMIIFPAETPTNFFEHQLKDPHRKPRVMSK
jgi:hypothetical protein